MSAIEGVIESRPCPVCGAVVAARPVFGVAPLPAYEFKTGHEHERRCKWWRPSRKDWWLE